MNNPTFRHAIKRTWKGSKNVEYLDTGNNDPTWANAILKDVQQWDKGATCTIVKCQLPWNPKEEIPILIA